MKVDSRVALTIFLSVVLLDDLSVGRWVEHSAVKSAAQLVESTAVRLVDLLVAKSDDQTVANLVDSLVGKRVCSWVVRSVDLMVVK